jgi:hypothetical protein
MPSFFVTPAFDVFKNRDYYKKQIYAAVQKYLFSGIAGLVSFSYLTTNSYVPF